MVKHHFSFAYTLLFLALLQLWKKVWQNHILIKFNIPPTLRLHPWSCKCLKKSSHCHYLVSLKFISRNFKMSPYCCQAVIGKPLSPSCYLSYDYFPPFFFKPLSIFPLASLPTGYLAPCFTAQLRVMWRGLLRWPPPHAPTFASVLSHPTFF